MQKVGDSKPDYEALHLYTVFSASDCMQLVCFASHTTVTALFDAVTGQVSSRPSIVSFHL